MNSVLVDLRITPEEFQRLYKGDAKDVVAYAVDGQRVRFPAKILVPFVTHYGIVGKFLIQFTAQQRFHSIHRLE